MPSDHPDFSLGCSRILGRVVIDIQGALTANTAPELEKRLIEVIDGHGDRQVVLDLRETTLVDFAGFLVLVDALKRLQSDGGDLVLSGPQKSVTEAFRAAGLDKAFVMTPSWTHPSHGALRPDRWGITGAR